MLGRAKHRLIAGRLPAIFDVLAHGAVQQRRILADIADGGPKALLGHTTDVLPVDPDRALMHVEKPQGEIDERRLSRTGTADQPTFAGRDAQREILITLPCSPRHS